MLLIISVNTSFTQIIHFDPQKSISQYLIKSWTTDDGLASNALRNIIQTKDGYIWIASYDGIIRFDGIDFHTYNSFNTKTLLTDAIRVLHEDKNGILWIGTQKGIILHQNNKFFKNIELETLDPCNIEIIYADKKNHIWIGTNANGLFKYQTDTLIRYDSLKTLTQSPVQAIFEDDAGIIWIGTTNGELYKYTDSYFTKSYTLDNSIGIECFHQDADGTIWVGTTKGIFNLINASLIRINELNIQFVNTIIEDSYGLLWIDSFTDGLYRYNKTSNKLEHFTQADGLPSNMMSKIIIDNEGILWGATYRKGLFQITDGKFTCYSKTKGLSSNIVTAILEYTENTYWIATEAGIINVLQNGNITELTIKISLPSSRIKHLFKDSKGNVWISTYGGLIKKSPRKETLFDVNNGLPGNLIRLCFEDSKGNIWVGTNSSGLHKINPDNSVFTFNTENGLSSDFIMAIIEDNEGNIIAGTKNGLNFIKNDRVIKQFKTKDGLPDNFSFNIYEDSEDILWIATNTGLSRMYKGEFTNYNIENGLITNIIYDILEDNLGYFWLPGPKGITKVSKNELNDFAEGKIKHFICEFFDKSDGMKNSVCLGAMKYLKSSDGRLWFLTAEGIAIIDPENITLNEELPKVVIEQIYTGNDIYYPDNNIEIKPGNKRFNIKYSALSYIAPEKIQFKYKLEPFEEEWVFVENKRTALYTNIPPGAYTFRVLSTNSDGIWSKKETFVQISVLPSWWQTWLFKIITFLFILASIYYLYRLKIKRIELQKAELEKLVQLRTVEVVNQKEEILAQRDEIEKQRDKVINQKKEITDSIVYAERIQTAILPPHELISKSLPQYFVLYKPRDIVSGDFYWLKEIGDFIILAVADCTGHGVPGAFMSMLGVSFLNEIVRRKEIIQPNQALNVMRDEVKLALRQSGKEDEADDGINMAILSINFNNMEIQYAGAFNSIIIIRKGEINEIKGDKMPIGISYKDKESFTNHVIQLQKDDLIYLSSDGYIDQFGGPDDRRFTSRRFRELLLEIHKNPIYMQKEIIQKKLNAWKGDRDQIDDILVFGFKI